MTEFSAREIEQIVHLWDEHMHIANKVDRRIVRSRKVQTWAVDRGLCLWECQHGHMYDGWSVPPWSHVQIDEPTARSPGCRWTLRFRKLGDPFQSGRRRFSSERDLPVKVLWHYVQQFLYHDDNASPRGYSINSCREWLTLNIYESGNRYDPENKHMDFRVTCLERLHAARYIIFQHAGSIWQITVTERGRDEQA